jgi:hypothetical protein
VKSSGLVSHWKDDVESRRTTSYSRGGGVQFPAIDRDSSNAYEYE